MTTNIDFLPARYNEQSVRRRSRIWLLSILAIFAGVVVITHSIQLALARKVERQLAAVDFQHSSAQATRNVWQRLQSNLATARATAGLYAELESHWPRTRILLAMTEPLTNEITLSELTIAQEVDEEQGVVERMRRVRPKASSESKETVSIPAQRDFQLLKQQSQDKLMVVRLAGSTTSDVALHRYVTKLNEHPLAAKAELLSFESSSDGDAAQAEFLVRVRIRQVHELAFGPASSNAAPQTASKAARKQ